MALGIRLIVTGLQIVTCSVCVRLNMCTDGSVPPHPHRNVHTRPIIMHQNRVSVLRVTSVFAIKWRCMLFPVRKVRQAVRSPGRPNEMLENKYRTCTCTLMLLRVCWPGLRFTFQMEEKKLDSDGLKKKSQSHLSHLYCIWLAAS